MSPPYPSSQTQAQPGRTSTSAGVHQVTAQAGLHSRIAAQLPAIHRHVISEGTHPSRVECDAAILADAVPRLSYDRGSTCISDVHASTATGSPDLDAHGAMTAPERSARDGTVAPSSTVSAGCAAPGVLPSGYDARSTPRAGRPVWGAALGTRPPPSESTTLFPSARAAQTGVTTSSPCVWAAIGPRHGRSSQNSPTGRLLI